MFPKNPRNNLIALALSDLPIAGQQALAQHPRKDIREAVAGSSSTHACVLDTMLTPDSPNSRLTNQFAGTRATRIETLKEMWDTQNFSHEYLARNPLLPVELLTAALADTDNEVALSAQTNPATPEHERRKIQPHRAEDLAAIGGYGNFGGFLTMRAFDLVATNLWMLDEPKRWGNRIQRTLAWQPEASRETLTKLAHVYSGDMTQIMTHPALKGTDMFSLTVEQLLATNSIAATTLAIRKPEFTLADAKTILNATTAPEPHVIYNLVDRYGISALLRETWESKVWISPQCTAACTQMYALRYVRLGADVKDYETATEIITVLEDNLEHWKSFLMLLPHWHDNMVEAAKTACKL